MSVFYFICNHVRKWNKIISVAERVTENYFSNTEHVGKVSWAATSLWNGFEI